MVFGFYYITIVCVLVAVGGGLNQEGQLILSIAALFSLAFKPGRDGVGRFLRNPLALAFVFLPAIQVLNLPGIDLPWWDEFRGLGNALPQSVSKAPLRTVELFFLYLAISVLLFGFLESQRDRGQSMRLYMYMAVLIGLGGLVSIFANHFGWSYAYQADSHVFSFFPNRNQHGFMFAVGVVLGVHIFIGSIGARIGVAIVGLLCSLSSFGGLLFSISKGAFFLALLGAVVCLAFGGSKLTRKYRFGLGVIGCCVAALMIVLYGERISERLVAAVGILADGESFRVKIWKDSFPFWRDYFFSGVGVGQFESNFWQYRNFSVNDRVVSHPENDYLWWFFEYGFLGIALCALAGIGLMRSLARNARRMGNHRDILGLAVIAMGLIHGLFDISMHIPATLLIVLLFVGTSVHVGEKNSSSSANSVFQLIVIGGALGMISILWSIGILSEDYAFHSDEIKRDALVQDLGEEIGEYDIDLSNAMSLFPLDWELYALWGHRLVRKSDLEEGDLAFESARFLDPITYRPAFREGVAYLPVSTGATMRAWAETLRRYPDHGDIGRVYDWMRRESRSYPEVRDELEILESIIETRSE